MEVIETELKCLHQGKGIREISFALKEGRGKNSFLCPITPKLLSIPLRGAGGSS